jgi:hypothetical protein
MLSSRFRISRSPQPEVAGTFREFLERHRIRRDTFLDRLLEWCRLVQGQVPPHPLFPQLPPRGPVADEHWTTGGQRLSNHMAKVLAVGR